MDSYVAEIGLHTATLHATYSFCMKIASRGVFQATIKDIYMNHIFSGVCFELCLDFPVPNKKSWVSSSWTFRLGTLLHASYKPARSIETSLPSAKTRHPGVQEVCTGVQLGNLRCRPRPRPNQRGHFLANSGFLRYKKSREGMESIQEMSFSWGPRVPSEGGRSRFSTVMPSWRASEKNPSKPHQDEFCKSQSCLKGPQFCLLAVSYLISAKEYSCSQINFGPTVVGDLTFFSVPNIHFSHWRIGHFMPLGLRTRSVC